MSVNRKLVSVLLVLVIPTVSAVALSACLRPMPEMGSPHSDMAMMGMASPEPGFAALPSNLCCEVSPAETAPGPARPSVSDETYSVLMPAAAAVQISQTTKTTASYHEVPPGSPPARALLCAFLI